LNGLDFQAESAKGEIRIPILFITGHGDIPMTVRPMKAGAVDFLAKLFRDQDLLDAVVAAIQREEKRREHEHMITELKAHFQLLTSRELVASGLKKIAANFDLNEVTVKVQSPYEENGREIGGRSGQNGRSARHHTGPSVEAKAMGRSGRLNPSPMGLGGISRHDTSHARQQRNLSIVTVSPGEHCLT
jgi:FixJ family two-component response regulator